MTRSLGRFRASAPLIPPGPCSISIEYELPKLQNAVNGEIVRRRPKAASEALARPRFRLRQRIRRTTSARTSLRSCGVVGG